MLSSSCTALVRTFNSGSVLPATLASLSMQTMPPEKYVFVDSGSTDGTKDMLPEGAIVHDYISEKFNYSESLNAGVPYVDTQYTMVISSHTCLSNAEAIEFAIGVLGGNDDYAAAYFIQGCAENMSYETIGPENFSGFNGVWNTCAIYKTSFLKKRPFRPEVFSAEDQEWSQWLISNERKLIVRIAGGGMYNNNPKAASVQKNMNEKLSIAIHVRKDMRGFAYIAKTAIKVVRPVSSANDRIVNALLFYRLLRFRLGLK